MGTLWLYAMPLDDVRAFFAAPAELADELIDLAGDVVVEAPPAHLIGKVGPLFKRPIAPIIDLPGPTLDDARAVVAGRAMPPDRLAPAWTIIQHWLDARAAARTTIDIDPKQIESLDFCLVSGGLSSQFSLGTMIARDPRLPLRPAPGMQIGWMPNHYVTQAAAQWRDAVADCPVADETLGADRTHLAQFFAVFERTPDGPPPDVLALYR